MCKFTAVVELARGGAFAGIVLLVLFAARPMLGEVAGPSGFLRSAPEPLVEVEPLPPDDPTLVPRERLSTLPRLSASYLARASVIVDSTRLSDFAKGTFMPAAIPVEGENFFDFGERATVQGNGSAVRFSATGTTSYAANYSATASFVLSDASATGFRGEFSQAYVQYEQLLMGVTETAFADTEALLPIVDLANTNAMASVLSPTGGNGQGRLSYFFYPSGDPYQGFIGNVSLEQPTPEISFTSGATPATTFATFAHFPDLILTMKYSEGQMMCAPGQKPWYDEFWHLQLGSVVRDLGLKNGDKSIDDAAFGWGLNFSGFSRVTTPDGREFPNGVGFSIIYGEGIGHYVNDLHVVATDQRTGGNDALLVGGSVEPLPVFAYYAGYLHNWTDSWQSTLVYSQVDLDDVPGQSQFAYRRGNYAVVNLLYHRTNNEPERKFKYFFTGLEYLFGLKEALNGNEGDAHRVMFTLSLAN